MGVIRITVTSTSLVEPARELGQPAASPRTTVETLTEVLRGPPGPSNYEVAVANGFQGTEAAWLASLRVSAGGYEFTQELPAAVWTVPHNLNTRPVVVVVDHLGHQVMADVDYLDANTVQVTHAIALTGAVYCK